MVWYQVLTGLQIKAVEDLHKLTRELKELWLAGPLRGIGEGEDEKEMAEDAREVTKLVDSIAVKVQELNTDADAETA